MIFKTHRQKLGVFRKWHELSILMLKTIFSVASILMQENLAKVDQFFIFEIIENKIEGKCQNY